MENFTSKLILGDSLGVMRAFPGDFVDLMVTDPTYYPFMGKDWCKAIIGVEYWKECLRLLKPGAFAFVMCAPRQDVLSRMIFTLKEAGFRTGFTSIYWTYTSGFPKSQNISKAIDKRECRKRLEGKLKRRATKEEFKEAWEGFRKIVNKYKRPDGSVSRKVVSGWGNAGINLMPVADNREVTAPATPQAKTLEGAYAGFQPKPAVEAILVVMKPLSEKTYLEQALKNQKGITWLNDCRIPTNELIKGRIRTKSNGWSMKEGNGYQQDSAGRFPANLLINDDVLGDKNSRYFNLDKWWEERNKKLINQPCSICGYTEEHGNYVDLDDRIYCDECLISGDYLDAPKLNTKELPALVQKTFPFLIVPKATRKEKNKGCEELEEKLGGSLEGGNDRRGSRNKPQLSLRKNYHPTVKPIKLMSYLIILGSRAGDIVLDPFMGTGTTCVATELLDRRYLGIDNDKGYYEIATRRVRYHSKQLQL